MGRIPGCRNRAYNRKRVYPQFCVDTAKRCKIELEYFKAGAAPAAPGRSYIERHHSGCIQHNGRTCHYAQREATAFSRTPGSLTSVIPPHTYPCRDSGACCPIITSMTIWLYHPYASEEIQQPDRMEDQAGDVRHQLSKCTSPLWEICWIRPLISSWGMLQTHADYFCMGLRKWNRPVAEIWRLMPFDHLCQQRKSLAQLQPYHQGADIRAGHCLGERNFSAPLLNAGEHIIVGKGQLGVGGQVRKGNGFFFCQGVPGRVDHLKLLLL